MLLNTKEVKTLRFATGSKTKMDTRFPRELVACLLWACGCAASAQALTKDQLAEVDRYLVQYMRGVAVTRKVPQPDGDDISCVDIHRQPAINNPHFNGKVDAPSKELIALLGGNVKEAEPSTICPAGSVEMRLPTREQIIARGGLKKFLSKFPDGRGGGARSASDPQPPMLSGHYYAAAKRQVNAYAAQTTINVWRPVVSSGAFSVTQIWLSGGSGSALQTVEAGVQVFPTFYNTVAPILFIYYTSDGYKTGCYNLECASFVQTSSVVPLGKRLNSSTAGGTQVEITLAWHRDPTWGHWYLFVKNADGSYTAAGYYPWGVFNGGQLSQYAQYVDVGGEVYTPLTGTLPSVPMGSGKHPVAYGAALYRNVAYHRNVQYMDLTHTTRDYEPWSLPKEGVNACAYSIHYAPASAPSFPGWGSTFWFGGSGFSSTCTGQLK